MGFTKSSKDQIWYPLKLTYPLKMEKTILSFWSLAYFQVLFAVSFRVPVKPKDRTTTNFDRRTALPWWEWCILGRNPLACHTYTHTHTHLKRANNFKSNTMKCFGGKPAEFSIVPNKNSLNFKIQGNLPPWDDAIFNGNPLLNHHPEHAILQAGTTWTLSAVKVSYVLCLWQTRRSYTDPWNTSSWPSLYGHFISIECLYDLFFLQQTMANCYFKRSTCFFVNHFLQINLSQHQNPIQTVCTSQVAGHSECTAEGFDLSRHQKSWLHMNNLSILAGPQYISKRFTQASRCWWYQR